MKFYLKLPYLLTWLFCGLFTTVFLCFPLNARAELIPIPPLTRAVTDLVGALPSSEMAALEQQLRSFSERKGTQLVVLILETTGAEAIEQFSIRLAESWGIGRKGIDDGVILVVARRDRAVRIEVGYGLEGAIPDAVAKRIIEAVILPNFRAGSLSGGISAGVRAIIDYIETEKLPAPTPNGSLQDLQKLQIAAFFGVALAFILRIVLTKPMAATTAAGLTLGLSGLFWSLGWGFIAAVIVLIFGLSSSQQRSLGRGYYGGGGGGMNGLGGVFRGGGGRFGGGGASGRW